MYYTLSIERDFSAWPSFSSVQRTFVLVMRAIHNIVHPYRHLPANLLASFIKRLSRLSLTAPPAAIIMAVPFTYNILKRHPALMSMIHRADAENPSSGKH